MSRNTEEIPVTINLLSEKNLKPLIHMKDLLNWNQTEDDIKRILQLNPNGNFGAYDGDRMTGTITTVVYGKELGWIGMMIVDPEYRRRGVATRLMNTALTFLHTHGIHTVKLDATPEGLPFYESMGFVSESTIERWEYLPSGDFESQVKPLEKSFLPAVIELDTKAFGTDRSVLLHALLGDTQSSLLPLISLSPFNGTLDGYAFARRGSNAYYVGPVIAKHMKAAMDLLNGMLGRLRNQKVYFDYSSKFGIPSGYFTRLGFEHQRSLTRMSLGGSASSATSQLVFAIAGPELG